jgi:DNA-binding MarR family transcriptional regulator|tara:strand:+ start:2039 stop:2446 length:408 start_codon:yes stop_codon:yes gene_type:complete
MKEKNTFKYRQLLSCKCLKMRMASRIATQFYDKKLKPIKIKITQFTILSIIASSNNKTVSSLSSELLMDRTTLTRSLDILIKQKLIKNIKSTDARERIVQLTTQGHVVLEQAIPLWKEAEEEIFDECKKYGFSAF